MKEQKLLFRIEPFIDNFVKALATGSTAQTKDAFSSLFIEIQEIEQQAYERGVIDGKLKVAQLEYHHGRHSVLVELDQFNDKLFPVGKWHKLKMRIFDMLMEENTFIEKYLTNKEEAE